MQTNQLADFIFWEKPDSSVKASVIIVGQKLIAMIAHAACGASRTSIHEVECEAGIDADRAGRVGLGEVTPQT